MSIYMSIYLYCIQLISFNLWTTTSEVVSFFLFFFLYLLYTHVTGLQGPLEQLHEAGKGEPVHVVHLQQVLYDEVEVGTHLGQGKVRVPLRFQARLDAD